MTEQQPYDVLVRHGDVEIRRYQVHVVAETSARGGFEMAGNLAFRPLFRYITGHNRGDSAIAMTAPVVQQAGSGAQLAMTAPVVQQAGERGHVVGFVMPAGSTLENLPEPLDEAVRLREVPEEHAAALRYSGRWSEGSYRAKERELLAVLEHTDWAPDGPARFARFDPPWTPGFWRHNEVVVPVGRRSLVRRPDEAAGCGAECSPCSPCCCSHWSGWASSTGRSRATTSPWSSRAS